MTDRSARFALPYILPGQAQKEVFHNEALALLDGALHPCVEEVGLSAPSSDPQVGQRWIVGADASGAWAGHEAELAVWTAGGWRFVTPVAGMAVWVRNAGHPVLWTGAAWNNGALPTNGVAVGGLQVVGARQPAVPSPSGGTTIDAEARAALGQVIVALRSHGLIH